MAIRAVLMAALQYYVAERDETGSRDAGSASERRNTSQPPIAESGWRPPDDLYSPRKLHYESSHRTTKVGREVR